MERDNEIKKNIEKLEMLNNENCKRDKKIRYKR